jgi:predicted methyltransferase
LRPAQQASLAPRLPLVATPLTPARPGASLAAAPGAPAMKHALSAALMFATLAAAAAQAASPPAPISPAIAAAIASPARPKHDRDVDPSRAPAETLAFVGVKPGMTVVELYPGGGYFTRPLSELVGPTGKVVAVETSRWKGAAEADAKMIAELGRKNVVLDVEPFGELPANTPPADIFWITQNYHDLKVAEFGQVDLAAFNAKVFAMLKPGGTYFILDHQANGTLTADQIAKLHRIDKATVIREVEAAGFKLAAEGQFLHRPADDHTLGIFDKAIQGKTDQYALKFVKPKA